MTVQSVGVLDVTVGYKGSSQQPVERPLLNTPISFSLGVVRLAGLKVCTVMECVAGSERVCLCVQRAAAMAARDHPLPLDFAAEAGVNPYVKMSTAHIILVKAILAGHCMAPQPCQMWQDLPSSQIWQNLENPISN